MYITSIINPILVVPSCDILLIGLIGNKARWFQLHTVTNVIITCIIINDCR